MGTTKHSGDWTDLRKHPRLREVDLHFADTGALLGRGAPFHEKMSAVFGLVESEVKAAAASADIDYLLIVHGKSTSRRGRTSSRSVVRGLMRNKTMTPYIDRPRCIQHETAFLVALRH